MARTPRSRWARWFRKESILPAVTLVKHLHTVRGMKIIVDMALPACVCPASTSPACVHKRLFKHKRLETPARCRTRFWDASGDDEGALRITAIRLRAEHLGARASNNCARRLPGTLPGVDTMSRAAQNASPTITWISHGVTPRAYLPQRDRWPPDLK